VKYRTARRIPLRAAWVALLLILAVTIYASSAGARNSSGPVLPNGKPFPTNKIHLTMWWWGQQEAHGSAGWLATTIKLYEKLHPNVTITPVLQTTSGLVPAQTTACSAKHGPDIFYYWGGIWNIQDAWQGCMRPISDYIPQSELKHYINRFEDTYQGKVWGAPWYLLPSLPVLFNRELGKQAGIATPPRTWAQFMTACSKFNAAHITPFAAGIKDQFFGEWLWSTLEVQHIRSIHDIFAAVIGTQSWTDPLHADTWQRIEDMVSHKCFNSDVNSLDLYQGQTSFTLGKAGMTMVAGSDVQKFVNQTGVSKVAVLKMPTWANGPLSHAMTSTSQTLGITSWSKNPDVAADFIKFTHNPSRMKSFFQITGAFPADDRFNPNAAKLPQLRTLWSLVKAGSQGGAPYPANFYPQELDSEGTMKNVQLVLAGQENAQQAAKSQQAAMVRIRATHPSDIANFSRWAESFK
jgi:raffinose/stachyose/melibiose transport system substrate-binding protein